VAGGDVIPCRLRPTRFGARSLDALCVPTLRALPRLEEPIPKTIRSLMSHVAPQARSQRLLCSVRPLSLACGAPLSRRHPQGHSPTGPDSPTDVPVRDRRSARTETPSVVRHAHDPFEPLARRSKLLELRASSTAPLRLHLPRPRASTLGRFDLGYPAGRSGLATLSAPAFRMRGSDFCHPHHLYRAPVPRWIPTGLPPVRAGAPAPSRPSPLRPPLGNRRDEDRGIDRFHDDRPASACPRAFRRRFLPTVALGPSL